MIEKKDKIYQCAKELFSTKGYKDTNITDITKMAGMATGTFYNYYSSKDKLFMDIYMDENEKLKKRVIKKIDIDGDPIDVTKQMMYMNYEGMKESPILKQWYNREVFSKIEENFRKESGVENVSFMYDQFIEVVKRWQERGKMRSDIDSEMIMAMFTALVTIDTHKEEVGINYFPDVLGYISDFVMKGLTE